MFIPHAVEYNVATRDDKRRSVDKVKKLIAFDFDGTLVDGRAVLPEALVYMCEKMGLPAPNIENILRGYAQPENYDYGWGLCAQEREATLKSVFLNLQNEIAETGKWMSPLVPGTADFLRSLHGQGHDLVIVTANRRPVVERTLKEYGLWDFFSDLRSQEDVDGPRQYRHKPYPDKLLCVMKEFGADPDQTVMIGDTTMDIQAGLAAGAETIGVSWGMHPAAWLRDAGAHKVWGHSFEKICTVSLEAPNTETTTSKPVR